MGVSHSLKVLGAVDFVHQNAELRLYHINLKENIMGSHLISKREIKPEYRSNILAFKEDREYLRYRNKVQVPSIAWSGN